jgi:hypothetical protein
MFVTQHPPQKIAVMPTKLIVVDRPSVAKGSVAFSARDAAVTKGTGTDAGDIEAMLTIAYGDGSALGGFVLPAADAGWIGNDAAMAKFVNRAAPSGTTTARVSVIKSGKLVKLLGRAVGDVPLEILHAGAPTAGVFAAYCITNGGAETCLCSAFPTCAYALVKGGTGARLVCTSGARDPACTALP